MSILFGWFVCFIIFFFHLILDELYIKCMHDARALQTFASTTTKKTLTLCKEVSSSLKILAHNEIEFVISRNVYTEQ